MSSNNDAANDHSVAPPYQMADVRILLTGIVFDEGPLRARLPRGVEPVAGATGVVATYTCGTCYPFGAYSGMYVSADVEGYDAPDGSKARVMLGTSYGPQPEPALLMSRHMGFPTSVGTTRIELTARGVRGTTFIGDQDLFTAEMTIGPTVTRTSGLLRWVSCDKTEKIVVSDEPWVGDFAEATLIAASLSAAADSIFAPLPIAEYQWAAEIGNAAFAFIGRPGRVEAVN